MELVWPIHRFFCLENEFGRGFDSSKLIHFAEFFMARYLCYYY